MITKKIICLILVFILAFSMALPAFAASGVNKAEMQVLKMMDKGVKLDEGFYQYRNALKNYFNRDNISITQVQADKACEVLLEYYDSYIEDDPLSQKRFLDKFMYVLMYLNVRVMYDPANSTANFIAADGSYVMKELKYIDVEGSERTVALNTIRQTGSDYSAFVYAGFAAVFFACGCVIVLKIKKGRNKLHGNQ